MIDITSLSRDEAAKAFLEKIIRHAYDGTTRGILEILEKGPPNPKVFVKEEKLHNWFQSLDEKSREKVQVLIQYVADMVIFSFLAVLDNKTIGLPIEGHSSDYAVCLQLYESDTAMFSYMPQASIRLNLSYDPDGDLHDAVTHLLQSKDE
jgi:hypothetical protein